MVERDLLGISKDTLILLSLRKFQGPLELCARNGKTVCGLSSPGEDRETPDQWVEVTFLVVAETAGRPGSMH